MFNPRQSIVLSSCTFTDSRVIFQINGSSGYLGLSFATIRGFNLPYEPPPLKWFMDDNHLVFFLIVQGFPRSALWIIRYSHEIIFYSSFEIVYYPPNPRMKSQYDSSHRDVQFQVGDQVLVRIRPHRQVSVSRTQ